MLAGAQLGITICSILLGRVGEPAVAHLLEKPFGLLGIPDALLHTVSFLVALTIVVVLHVLLGEMVPKNIAIAGPESAAMLLVPAYLVWVRIARPFIAFYNWCAQHDAAQRAASRRRTNWTNTVSTRRTVGDDRRIALGGPARPRGTQPAVAGPADPQPGGRRRRGAAERSPRRPRRRAKVRAPPSPPSSARWPRPATPGSPSSTRRGASSATCTSRTCCRSSTIPTPSWTGRWCGRCPSWPRRCRCPMRCRGCGATTATWRWSPPTDGIVSAMVALEDLVEDLVGTVRDGTPRG